MTRERRQEPVTLTVHLMGGLGNQLFQYALGRHLAIRNDARLVLDATGYGPPAENERNSTTRQCELDNFRIVGEIIRKVPASKRRSDVLRRRGAKALRMLRRIADLRKPYYLRQQIVEPARRHFCFDRQVLETRIARNISVRGFWQSEEYFKDIAEELRRELTWVSSLPAEDRAIAERIEATASVAVHVRHGDNANPAIRSMGVLPRGYYIEAYRQLRQEVQAPLFLLFSDDPAWAQDMLGMAGSVTSVVRDQPRQAHRDLRLMALCKHHIVANSTLSWWGAWLGQRVGQIVYAPRRYFQNLDRPTPDLYPVRWRVI